MNKKRKIKKGLAVMAGMLAVAAIFGIVYRLTVSREQSLRSALNQTAKGTKATIVIDPGHGGTQLRK